MMLKVVLCVVTFAVVVNSFTTPRRATSILKRDDNEGQFPSSALDKNGNHGRGMGQTRQEQEEQWGRVREESQEQDRRAYGKQGEDEVYGGQGGIRRGLRVQEGQEGQVEQRRHEEQGNHNLLGKQTRLGENKGSSQEDSNESYEIMKVQKQYHDTDPVFAGNGRKVPNHMNFRGHKVREHNLQDSEEMVNKIYKDM